MKGVRRFAIGTGVLAAPCLMMTVIFMTPAVARPARADTSPAVELSVRSFPRHAGSEITSSTAGSGSDEADGFGVFLVVAGLGAAAIGWNVAGRAAVRAAKEARRQERGEPTRERP